MSAIARESLMSLKTYARERPAFCARVMAHKKRCALQVGEHVSLAFEDELTIRYQVQEMLRIELIFEEGGIRDELDAYNPPVPDGRNLKATMMIEYPDAHERRTWLARLIGIEDRVWVRVPDTKRYLRLRMRTWSAKMPRKPRRCISCASSSIPS